MNHITMRKIVVFGATGGTGREVVMQALARKLEVTAIVRDPSALNIEHELLTIVKGDVFQPSTFENKIKGTDIVISCLGAKNTKPTNIYSSGMMNIIEAMDVAQVRRLICLSACAMDINNKMGFFVRILTMVALQKIFKEMYTDMRLMERIVVNSNLDWTIVRPPMLTNKKITRQYRHAVHTNVQRPFSIGRADLADYILKIADDRITFQATSEISY